MDLHCQSKLHVSLSSVLSVFSGLHFPALLTRTEFVVRLPIQTKSGEKEEMNREMGEKAPLPSQIALLARKYQGKRKSNSLAGRQAGKERKREGKGCTFVARKAAASLLGWPRLAHS